MTTATRFRHYYTRIPSLSPTIKSTQFHIQNHIQHNNTHNINNPLSLFTIQQRYRHHKLFPTEDDKDRDFAIYSRRRNVKGGRKKFQNYIWHLKGMTVDEALIQMRFARSRRGYEFYSLLRNGQANAVNQFGMNPDNLIIENIVASRAHQPKVAKLRGKGRVASVKLRHSHLVCRIIEDSEKAAKSKRGLIGQAGKKRIIPKDRPEPNIIID